MRVIFEIIKVFIESNIKPVILARELWLIPLVTCYIWLMLRCLENESNYKIQGTKKAAKISALAVLMVMVNLVFVCSQHAVLNHSPTRSFHSTDGFIDHLPTNTVDCTSSRNIIILTHVDKRQLSTGVLLFRTAGLICIMSLLYSTHKPLTFFTDLHTVMRYKHARIY